MKLKLTEGFGTIRNIVSVQLSVDSPGNNVVGDMHMLRRSGWRGGPTYQFHPNEHGKALGLKRVVGSSVRAMLKQLGTESSNATTAKQTPHDQSS